MDAKPTSGDVDARPSTDANPTPSALRARLSGASSRKATTPVVPPLAWVRAIRLVWSIMLSVLCVLTVGGAVLMLLVWQQERAAGVLDSQLERMWDVFGLLRDIERWVAFATVPVVVVWIVVVTINLRRSTGRRRNPMVAAGSLVLGLAGVWLVGDRIIADASDDLGRAAGIALQLIFAAIPLVGLERVVEAAEARHRPLRMAYVMAAAYLIQLETLGGLSTIDATTDLDGWARTGGYLVIGSLLQALGVLAANEAGRSIEEGTEQRYQLRHRFGESVRGQRAT